MPSQVELAAQRIAETMAPAPLGSAVRWRWATVEAVNADGTMDVTIGGASVPALTALSGATGASAGDRVRVDYLGADAVVTGIVADGPGASTPAGTVLWSSGGWAMAADQTAPLSYNVSTCPTGIVLHWQPYTSSTLRNYYHHWQFVPKEQVASYAGTTADVTLSSSKFASVATKTVYVSDNRVTGHADNTATGTANGITYANSQWVLTQIIAV